MYKLDFFFFNDLTLSTSNPPKLIAIYSYLLGEYAASFTPDLTAEKN